MTREDARERARMLFDSAEFAESLETARRGLSDDPDDVQLLILAGRAGTEVDAADAVEYLRRATELAPDDARAWCHLGEALVAEGSMAEADAAFRRTVELDPDDQTALVHLGHTSLAAGRKDEGVGFLARAAEIAHAPSTASISLVDMYREGGDYENALTQARRIVEVVPEDTLAWLDVAELSLTVGQLDEARSAFERLRELDEVPGHEVYPLHGMLQVEIRRGNWNRARELAEQAAAIDPYGLGADVGAFLDERISGPGEEPAATQAEVEAALGSSLAQYRRMHADDRLFTRGDSFG